MTTPILLLPEITEDQASKYLTHNEALRMLEALRWGGVVLSATTTAPTGAEADGAAYILPASPAGAWASHVQDDIVVRVGGAWKASRPGAGVRHYFHVVDTNTWTAWDGAAWAAAAAPGAGVPVVASAAWWRINIIETQFNFGGGGSTTGAIDEMEFRLTAGVAEAMPSASAFATSEFSAQYAAAHAFDGTVAGASADNIWHSATDPPFPYHLGIQFAAAREAKELWMRAATDVNHFILAPRDFDIQNSSDGLVWATVKAIRGVVWTAGEVKTFSI